MVKTKVIFRKSRHGVLALFPELPGTMDPHTCLCYEHVGQHGSADVWISRRGYRLAAPDEYADLKRELETAYCYELDPVKRITPTMTRVRLAALKGGKP